MWLNMKKYFKSFFSSAFTLAETLIVIGVIGIVAALTLPNLNSSTGDKEKVTKVKKIYSSISEAFDRAQAIYGDYDTWFLDLQGDDDNAKRAERFAKRITEFMKLSKDCGFGTGCFASNSSFEKDTSSYKVITADGMSISFRQPWYTDIFVDIDGPNKGKCSNGYDIFEFEIFDDIDYVIALNSDRYSGPSASECLFQMRACASGWIIQNENLDYLKADSNGKCLENPSITLNWTTNTSCH